MLVGTNDTMKEALRGIDNGDEYICDRISKTRICESLVALDIRQLGGILGDRMEARGCKD